MSSISGFVHSEGNVRYFGEDVQGVSQVNKKLFVDLPDYFLFNWKKSQQGTIIFFF